MDHATVVENAVNRFYTCGDNEAHNWLLQAQTSKEAWTFVWQLMDPSKSGEVQFFAANTLYAKISKQWDEVPKSDILDLRARLFEVLKRPGTSTIVLLRLCQAFAAFMVNYNMSNMENKEKCMVEELVELLPYNSPETVGLLVRVLEAIPKEVNITPISPAKYYAYLELKQCNVFEGADSENAAWLKMTKQRESMILNWQKTVLVLEQIFLSCNKVNINESKALYLLGIECTYAWLKIGQLPIDTIGHIYPHLLFAAAHFIPRRDDMEGEKRGLDAVQDCLTMVITHTELYKLPQLFWHWGKSLICMVEQYGASHYYDILTAFGEAHSRSILLALIKNDHEDNKWTAQKLIEYLLQCSEQEGRYPYDEKQSIIPFGFWYALQDDLSTLDPPADQEAKQALKPIYARLAQALVRKSVLPVSPSESGSDEDRELLRCYRQDSADTLIYCFNVLHQDLFIMLGQRLSQPHEDISKWPEVESLIHAFKALSDSARIDTVYEYVAAIMNLLITHIPYHIYPREVLCCACSTMGDYAEWIGDHPQWLERALQLIMIGLTNGPVTAPAATMALKDITRECDSHLGPLAPSLLETISKTLQTVPSGGGEGLRLMYATGKLLNTLSSQEEQIKHLEATMGLCLVRVRDLMQLNIEEAQLAVTNELKMVTMFFSTLEGTISDAVFQATLPIFESILQHPEWGKDEHTVGSIFVCISKAVPALKCPEREINRLLELLNESYKKCPIPDTLNCLKILVTLFGRHPDNIIVPVFSQVSRNTLNFFITNQMKGLCLSEQGDLLEAYMGLLGKVCSRNARMLLLIPDQVPDMLHMGMACLVLPEVPIHKAASLFLMHAITQNPHLQTFIQPIGQELTCIIIHSLMDLSKRRNTESFAEVLVAMNKACDASRMNTWLNNALEEYPLSDKVKGDLIPLILRERISKRRMTEKLRYFCTIYDNMRYKKPVS